MRRTESIKEVLKRRISHYGLTRQAEAAQVCAVASEVAAGEHILAPESPGYKPVVWGFEPVSFRAGTLKIRVASPEQGHLLRLREKELIGKINARLEAPAIKRIRYEIDRR